MAKAEQKTSLTDKLDPQLVELPLSELMEYPDNPNKGNVNLIMSSIRSNGFYPTITIQRSTKRVIKGNHTRKALIKLNETGRYKDAFSVVKVVSVDCDEETALSILLADNQAARNSYFDNQLLYDNLVKVKEKSALGLEGTLIGEDIFDELAFRLGYAKKDAVEEAENSKKDEQGKREDTTKVLSSDVPNTIWPSDNKFDIPLLSLDYCAQAIEMPVLTWGSQRGRKGKQHVGTWSFFTTDEILDPLWKRPNDVVNSSAKVAAEINYTSDDDTPLAYGIYQIYKKRWIARYWQSMGIKIIVDLNVGIKYRKLNLLGVPKGWSAFCVRGYQEHVDSGEMLKEYEMAQAHAGRNDILFVVFGGRQKVRNYCKKHGWNWFPDEYVVAHGELRDSVDGDTIG